MDHRSPHEAWEVFTGACITVGYFIMFIYGLLYCTEERK